MHTSHLKAKIIGAALSAAFFVASASFPTVSAANVSGPVPTFDDVPDAAQEGDIVFSMARKGKTIGHHSMNFTPLEDGTLQVDVAIAIKVKIAFITVFKYAHHNREIWSADGTQLLSIDAKTSSNGDDVAISGVRDGDIFRMTDQDGETFEIEGRVVPTSYWNAGILNADAKILNSQKGAIAETVFAAKNFDMAPLPGGKRVNAQMFEAVGELNNVFVDYAKDGQCWVGLSFVPPKQDVPIAYDLESYFKMPRPDLKPFAPLAPCLEIAVTTVGAAANNGTGAT